MLFSDEEEEDVFMNERDGSVTVSDSVCQRRAEKLATVQVGSKG